MKNKVLLSRFYRMLMNVNIYRLCVRKASMLMKCAGITDRAAEGENEWCNRWGQLFKVSKKEYRLYASYVEKANCIDIVPESVLYGCIEPILNPYRYRSLYSDKNYYDRIFPKGSMPKTVLRKIVQIETFLDADYRPMEYEELLLSPFDMVIVKPSVGTSSGEGVELLEKSAEGSYRVISSGEQFSREWLGRYKNGFIVQECVRQSAFMAQFNSSSVNTLRVSVYKSVADGKSHAVSAVLRIGKSGAFVDNAHRGGRLVGIDMETGKLNSYVCDQYGVKVTEFNGIDFTAEDYYVPNWKDVLSFAEDMADHIYNQQLIAMDIMLDISGLPKLIEINVAGFGGWAFLFSGMSVFGKYTDEIVSHCIREKGRFFYTKQFIS